MEHSSLDVDALGLRQTPNGSGQSASRYDFFIASATADRRLQDGSCEVVLDVEEIRPGALWQPALLKALEASRAIVVLVSTHTTDAFYQQKEIVRAMQLAREKPRAHTVIPVILEKLPQGPVRMPYGMSIQVQDATRPGGLKRVAAELIAWLAEQPSTLLPTAQLRPAHAQPDLPVQYKLETDIQPLESQLPPLLVDVPEPMRQELAPLTELDNATLQQIAQSVWSPAQHARYTALLDKEHAGTITPPEKDVCEALYHDANRHMLRKAYANALLKWRGHSPPAFVDPEGVP
jgi:TIR domain